MFKKFSFTKELSKEEELQEYICAAKKVPIKYIQKNIIDLDLDIENYEYSPAEAILELGLDEELVQDLVEDFVIQIVKYKPIFLMYIDRLRKKGSDDEQLDYTKLRDLAHKNLGVARNLRIADAQFILSELMKKDDLDYLDMCAKALEACVIKLKPEVAFKTSKLIEIKVSL